MKRFLSLALLTVFLIALIGCSNQSEAHPTITEPANKLSNSGTNKNHSNTSTPFTNKYGTATTKCAHSGCNNYIARSGDTNCCTTHSNKCLDCKKYIDEDAYYCVSCIAEAATPTCEACSKKATYSIKGITGQTEYYCTTHYNEMKELLEWMENY